MRMYASVKHGPLVLHYLLMLSDNLRNWRAISGDRMIFESSASEPISPSAHHSPTRLSSLSLILLITPSLRAGGWLQPGHDRLDGIRVCVCVCVCVSLCVRLGLHCLMCLDNARSCLSDTVQSNGALYRSPGKLHPHTKGQKGQSKNLKTRNCNFFCC